VPSPSASSKPGGTGPGPGARRAAPTVDVIGVQEFASVADGVLALDAIVKAAPVDLLGVRTVTPGKLVVLFTGDVASVEASLTAGREVSGESLIDELFIPNLHPRVIPAIRGEVQIDSWDALGIIESFSVTASIAAADIAVKEGRAAVAAGVGHVRGRGLLCQQVIIPRPHPDIRAHVLAGGEQEGTIWK
jgi:microcompartment protein CcmL/EutN